MPRTARAVSSPSDLVERALPGAGGNTHTPHGRAAVPFVRSNAVVPFLDFLDGVGAPTGRLLDRAGIPSLLFEHSEALVPAFSVYRLLELAARQERLHALGEVVAQRACAFDLGAYGAFLQGAVTVYDYLKIGVRMIGAHSSATTFWLIEEGESLRVNQHLSVHPGLGRNIADHYTLVLTLGMLRRMIGPAWSPGEVRLLSGNEALIADRDAFGDAPLIVGCPHSSFTISRALLGMPVVGARSGAGARHAQRANGSTMPVDFESSIKQVITSLFVDGYPSMQASAVAAGMSPRTLQRRLAEVGATYSGLVAGIRLELARDYLASTDMQIAELAALLGYTDTSNFVRAFRRHAGVPPGVYRRSLASC